MSHSAWNPLLEFDSEEPPPARVIPQVTNRVILGVIALTLLMLFLGLASNQTAANAAPSPLRVRGSASATSATSPAPGLRITYPASTAAMSVAATYIVLGGTSSHAESVAAAALSVAGERHIDATGAGAWIAAVPLERGENTIVVAARGSRGQITTRTVVVRRESAEPNVQFSNSQPPSSD